MEPKEIITNLLLFPFVVAFFVAFAIWSFKLIPSSPFYIIIFGFSGYVIVQAFIGLRELYKEIIQFIKKKRSTNK